MKHIILICVLAVGLPCGSHARPAHLDIMVPDIRDSDLKGPVKSVEHKVWKNVSDEYTLEKSEYDREGNLLKVTEQDKDGNPIETTTFIYDENGCYIRKLYKDEKKDAENSWEVILNAETRQIARRADDGRICVETYSPQGYLLSYRQMDKDQKPIFSREYTRDESNRRTKYTYLKERKPVYTYYYKWTDNGFMDMEAQTYHQEKAKRRNTYEYLVTDGHGNWTQRIMVRYDISGKQPVKVYEHTVQRKIEYYDDRTAGAGPEGNAAAEDTDMETTADGEQDE